MKFGVGLIFYNEAKNLKRCLPTLGEFDKIYCVDGRFPLYAGHASPLSDDGSRKIVKKCANAVLIDCPLTDETAKRNAYLKAATQDKIDVVVIVDADEYLIEKDWRKFVRECKKFPEESIYRMWAYNASSLDPQPRLIFRPELFEYYLRHYVFRHKPTGRFAMHSEFSKRVVEGFKIATDDTLRTKAHIDHLSKYQFRLVEYEQSILTDSSDIPNLDIIKPLMAQITTRSCKPPSGFVCETEDGLKDGERVHLYHNAKTGEYRVEPLVENAAPSFDKGEDDD